MSTGKNDTHAGAKLFVKSVMSNQQAYLTFTGLVLECCNDVPADVSGLQSFYRQEERESDALGNAVKA